MTRNSPHRNHHAGRFAVALALVVGGLGALTIAVPEADARSRLIAKERVVASRGGWVLARSGVGLYIPPRVMRRNGTVTIRALGKRRWNLHIHAPWSGRVAVRFPRGRGGRNHVAAHRVGPVWVRETSYAPGRTRIVWVTSLSWFSDRIRSLAQKACLTADPRKFVKCLVDKQIKSIPGRLASEIAQRISDSCWAKVRSLGQVPVQLLLDPACVGTASAPGLPQPPSGIPVGDNNGGSQAVGHPQIQGSAPAPNPAPTPTPTPAPAPAPAPRPSPPASKGYRVGDAYLGGTWARTDPNNGTWHSSGNRPANGAYWYPNNLGLGVDCARAAAPYRVYFADGRVETWNMWFHVTDGKWVPSAALQEIHTNGYDGLRAC